MSRFLTIFITFVLLAIPAVYAYGQENVSSNSGVKINISGEADLDYVYRDSTAMEMMAWTGGGIAGVKSDNFFSGKYTIHMEASLPDSAKLVIELENQRTTGGANLDAGADALGILFEQAYLEINEVYDPRITVKLGVMDVAYDLRGNGQSMVLAVNEAETSFGVVNGLSTTAMDTLEAAGININYTEGVVDVDVFGYTVMEAGANAVDENIYGAYLRYSLESNVSKGSHVDFMILNNNGAGSETDVWTIGGGLNLMQVSEGLDVWGEAYFQFGDAGKLGTATLDAGGFAAELGLRYSFANDYKPWLELSYWMISGDNSATDSKDDRFISYENVDEFLIWEDNDYGIDLDTNYTAIKFSGGISPREDIDITARLGFFSAQEDGRIAGTKDDLGTEFDLVGSYSFNKNISFDLTLAFLFGADAVKGYTVGTESSINMVMFGSNVKF